MNHKVFEPQCLSCPLYQYVCFVRKDEVSRWFPPKVIPSDPNTCLLIRGLRGEHKNVTKVESPRYLEGFK